MLPDIRESLSFDLHKYLKEGAKARSEICVTCYEAFGTAGSAPKNGSRDLEEMVNR